MPFTDVKLQDTFWAPRIETNRKVTIPHCLGELEKEGAMSGFAVLSGVSDEKYHGWMWGDSNVGEAQSVLLSDRKNRTRARARP